MGYYVIARRPAHHSLHARRIPSIQFIGTVILSVNNVRLNDVFFSIWNIIFVPRDGTYMKITAIILRWYQKRFDVVFDEQRIVAGHFRTRFEKILILQQLECLLSDVDFSENGKLKLIAFRMRWHVQRCIYAKQLIIIIIPGHSGCFQSIGDARILWPNVILPLTGTDYAWHDWARMYPNSHIDI